MKLQSHHATITETLKNWTIRETHKLLNLDVPFEYFRNYVQNYKLHPGRKIDYTAEFVALVRSTRGLPRAEVAKVLGDYLGRELTWAQVKYIRRTSEKRTTN